MRKTIIYIVIVLIVSLSVSCKSNPKPAASVAATPQTSSGVNTQLPAISTATPSAASPGGTQTTTTMTDTSATAAYGTGVYGSSANATNAYGSGVNAAGAYGAGNNAANAYGAGNNAASAYVTDTFGTPTGLTGRYSSDIILDGSTFYIVVEGDTLSYIARRIYLDGSLYPLIMMVNEVVIDPDKILPRQQFIIPALRVNMNDSTARRAINSFFPRIADIEDQRERHKAAVNIRNHAK